MPEASNIRRILRSWCGTQASRLSEIPSKPSKICQLGRRASFRRSHRTHTHIKKRKENASTPYGRVRVCLTNMLHLSRELAVANGPRLPTLCSCSEAFFFFSFFLSLALAVFPSAGGVKQRMCQKHMRSRVSARCVVLVLAVVVVVVVVVLHWSWPRVLLFISLLQLSLLCLRRPGEPGGATALGEVSDPPSYAECRRPAAHALALSLRKTKAERNI